MTRKIIFAFALLLMEVGTTVKMKVNDLSSPQLPSDITYMTLVEGSSDMYEICKLICRVNNMKTYYSETTIYPQYGKVFRCQCNENYTPWYDLQTFREVAFDLLRGNSIFNYYMNMPGNYINECECNNLKSLIFNILTTFKDLNI